MTRGSSGLDREAFDSERNQLFLKTKLCKFNLRGMCAKGPECPFAHGQGELRDLPDLRRTKLCAEYVQTGSCTKGNCTFAHSKAELRTTSKVHKIKCQEAWWGAAAVEPQWTSLASSEDETVDNEASLDYGYCRSVFETPDAVSMFSNGWGASPGGYLDMGCLDGSPSMTGMAFPDYSGSLLAAESPLSGLEGEPAYVSFGPSSSPRTALEGLWEQAAFGESVETDQSSGAWMFDKTLQGVLSE